MAVDKGESPTGGQTPGPGEVAGLGRAEACMSPPSDSVLSRGLAHASKTSLWLLGSKWMVGVRPDRGRRKDGQGDSVLEEVIADSAESSGGEPRRLVDEVLRGVQGSGKLNHTYVASVTLQAFFYPPR